MNIFDKALQFVLKWEGEYVNHPSDPGGETKYGICKRSYPNIDIKNLTLEKASQIYKNDYWDAIYCNQLPDRVAVVLFDTCVNCGPSRAVKILQESLCDLGEIVTIDGDLGKMTMRAISRSNPSDLAFEMLNEREEFYNNIIVSKPKLSVFKNGWINRINDLGNFIKTL